MANRWQRTMGNWVWYVDIALLVVFVAVPVIVLLAVGFLWWVFKDLWR